MERSDAVELRKELKKAPNQEGIIDWVYGFYVTPENEIGWESVRKFYTMDEEDRFRHSAIINRTLPAAIGVDLFPSQVKQNEDLITLRGIWRDDEEEMLGLLKPFQDMVRSGFTHTDPYYAALTHFTYDVPMKAMDGSKLDDGGDFYDAFLFSICPAKLSAPALGFEEGAVEILSRRWVIGSPVAGFLYPSFHDRSEDRNEAALFLKKEFGRELFEAIFVLHEEVILPEAQKSGWNQILSEVGVSTESAALINASLCEVEETSLGKKELRKIVEESGSSGDRFDEEFDKVAGERELPVHAISSPKVEVKTDSAKIQVPADKAVFIKTQIIDGIEYLLIPVDGQVLVNGSTVMST